MAIYNVVPTLPAYHYVGGCSSLIDYMAQWMYSDWEHGTRFPLASTAYHNHCRIMKCKAFIKTMPKSFCQFNSNKYALLTSISSTILHEMLYIRHHFSQNVQHEPQHINTPMSPFVFMATHQETQQNMCYSLLIYSFQKLLFLTHHMVFFLTIWFFILYISKTQEVSIMFIYGKTAWEWLRPLSAMGLELK